MAAVANYQKQAASLYWELPQPQDKVQCMHVYIDGTLRNFRTKDRTWPTVPKSPNEFERMEFCGSATDLDVGNLADYYARPVTMYRDPFRRGSNVILFCDTYNNKSQPTFANNRYRLLSTNKKLIESELQFSFHQPYTLLRKDGEHLCYMNSAYEPDSKSGFLCGWEIAESHYKACLYAGVQMSSLEPIKQEGQWRYSVSRGTLVQMCDDAWVSRFLLQRVGEDFAVPVSWDTSSCSRLPSVFSSIALQSHDSGCISRISKQLTERFLKEPHPVKITSSSTEVVVSGLPAEIDPYSIGCKILEACQSSF